MAITPYSGTVPNRNNAPSTFAANMDEFLAWLNRASTEINTSVAAFNFNATNSTSSTSLTIGTGSQSLTVQASKSYVEGMTVRIASTASVGNWMQGEVVSYNSGTGALVVNVVYTSGSGTIAAWTVSLTTSNAVEPNRLMLLSTVTASASATCDIETTFNSTYDEYLILGTAIVPSAAAPTLSCRMKLSGSYQTANYQYHISNCAASSATYSPLFPDPVKSE